jgi:hypothetical protein
MAKCMAEENGKKVLQNYDEDEGKKINYLKLSNISLLISPHLSIHLSISA